MGNSTIPESPYRVPFFIFYIVSAVIFIGLHVRFFMVSIVVKHSRSCYILSNRFFQIIQMSKELSKLPAYRIAQHSTVACGINIITELIAAACTITGDMDRTVNWVNGAFFHGSWAVEYPTVLLSAAHRLTAVAWPFSVDWIFSMQNCYIILAVIWCFGVFNGALCLSGQVYSIWVPTLPSFVFEGR
ncbi:hypothetical protein GCK32_007117 [Trichostrongylus colubriformis]|uniref:Uncharacterized protein n=1 Tax=Trichostrongylus colubriformis TaxID=6319 RepID=A0AAN8INY3_TRICO